MAAQKTPKLNVIVLILGLVFPTTAFQTNLSSKTQSDLPVILVTDTKSLELPKAKADSLNNLLAGAKAQTTLTKFYDQTYTKLAYPNGDVPIEKGVCTDVVIRAFRKAGIDLQKAVHEDMAANFNAYPKKWGLKTTDTSIDHRRVPNLQTYFQRKGKALAISNLSADYLPGDIITWDLNGKSLAHIGLVSDIRSAGTERFLIIHNIGNGARAEDRLFEWKITGHYRYF